MDNGSNQMLMRINELKKEYLANLELKRQRLQELCDALDTGIGIIHLSEMHMLLHNLSGTGSSFGFVRITQHARVIGMLVDNVIKLGAQLNVEQQDQIRILLKKLLEELAEPHVSSGAVVPDTDREPRKQLIFIVDDDEMFTQKLALELENAGFEIKVFDNPKDILSENQSPSVILMDMLFSDMEDTGAVSVKQYREKYTDPVSIIFISVCEDLEARLQAIRSGADYYLLKPLNMTHLLHVLDVLTGSRKAKPYTVLIVDDDEVILSYYKLTLLDAGIDVFPVSHPFEALEILKKIQPDLILTDLNMPDCNGWELAQIIRQHLEYLSIPILFMTTESSLDQKNLAIDFGADDYLIKPVVPGHLIRMVTSRARRYRNFTDLNNTLQASILRNESIIKSIVELVWSADPENWKLEFISPSVIDILGIPADEIMLNPFNWRNFIYINDIESVKSALKQLDNEDFIEISYRIVKRGNMIRWVHEKINRIFDHQGKASRLDGIINDVTNQEIDRQQIKRKLMMESELSAFTKHLLQYGDERAALESLLRLFGAHHVQIYHKIPDMGEQDDLVCINSIGETIAGSGLILSSQKLEQTLQNLKQHRILRHKEINLEACDTFDNLSVPVFTGNRFWGFINFLVYEKQHYANSEEEVLLNTISDIISHFYEKMKRKLEQEQQNRLLVLSSAVSIRLMTDEDLDTAMNCLQVQIKECTKYDHVFILSKINGKNRSQNTYCLAYDSLHNKNVGTDVKLRLSKAIIRFCAKHDSIWQVHFGANEAVILHQDELGTLETDSALCSVTNMVLVPVLYSSKPWGTICLVSTSRKHHLKKEHLAVLTSIGNSIGGAILRSHEHFVLVEARDAAQKANVAKSAFLANMSHEIRTPMNAILGFAQMLKTTNLNDVQADFANVIIDSGYKLLSIINDILDLSNLEVGKTQVTPSECSVDQIVNKIWTQYRPIIAAKNIVPELFVQDDIPLLMIDIEKVTRVLLSILSNAVKFTETGRITFQTSYREISDIMGELTFRVSDTGIGISEDKLGAIFNIFEQVDNSITRRYGGMGMGLGLSAKIVKILDGAISVQSNVNQGAEFTISIPFTKAVAAPMLIDSHNQINDHSGTVLIVEDNKINRMLLIKLLEPLNLNILSAENGELALAALESNPHIDAILMDVHMPIMSGFVATKRIKQNPKTSEIPVIALTASVLKDDIRHCQDAGMDDFLEKPVQINKLFSVLKKWIPKGNFAELSG